ncbi:MAG: DEAD/DEAH box helicase family protein [Candidatus Microthrix sp.]|nr:DEAD/DEAH box helicase family protein [Candidatus Microthrix sp.]MBK7019182.1 DEAD/DEAH box helicase family protein [Candidatus Microthrix sp.]
MSGSQFSFLEVEFVEQFEAAEKGERYALSDPRTAMIHARRALESGVKWVYSHDRALPQPYDSKLNTLLNELAFKELGGGHVFSVSKKIQLAGNKAVHEAKPPSKLDAVEVMSSLFRFCLWLAVTYARDKPDPKLTFNPHGLLDHSKADKKSLEEGQELAAKLESRAEAAELARQKAAVLAHTVEELEAERQTLLAQVAEAKKLAEQMPIEAQGWSESETRKYKIDALLGAAGWRLTEMRDREFEVVGMPSGSSIGKVDYVLWGDDGKPLAVVEAKKAMSSPMAGQHQAKLYADCLEAMTGQRPVIYYSNGYEHWLWDDTAYPPRSVQGFRTKDELVLMIQRRTSMVSPAALDIDKEIVGRHYQEHAIKAISEHFEMDRQRRALLVMATGAGKTRTVVALTDLLMRANLVKRVLFLADRQELVKQAVNAYKQHLPDSAPVNLLTEGNVDGRVYVSTYQTMVGKIDELRSDDTRRFGVGHFDLVVIDEAHRSVYRKYRGIFDYFDSLLVGLTATPKDEVDKNTYDLFNLETGVPTDAYSLEAAIADGFLVPPRSVSVPTKFLRDGVSYNDLTEEEQVDWDLFDWGEDEHGNPLDPPDGVDPAQLNKFLFNIDTVDKVLEVLMRDGIKVAGGDRLGKTIIFAKNQRHAEFIYERFIANYPQLDNGGFARVITHSVKYSGSLIDNFKVPEKAPHIAISVDMMDTGIDVPECANLVFFKMVRSKTKFTQMLGRGTRLSPDLFGPGNDKTHFKVFDFCQNLEYFSQEMIPADGAMAPPLSEQIFTARLELIQTFDAIASYGDERAKVAGVLREAIASMNPDNFLVRPHLELVERFREDQPWEDLSVGDLAALGDQVAKLPTELDPEHEDAKRFDVLVLNTQLGALRGEPYERQRRKIMDIAGALEDQQTIPVIAEQLVLIQAIQADEWWENVSYPMLEEVRRKLRALVQLIERSKKGVIYSDFVDEMGVAVEYDLPGTGGAVGSNEFSQFRKKAEHFLKENLGEASVAKVRSGEPLTPDDIADLQRILVAAGVGTDETFAEASEKAGNLGRFVRSIVGLDRAAAKRAFADFLDEKKYSKNQIAFVDLIINELAERGIVEAKRIYEAPYIGLAPEGPDGIFVELDVRRILELVGQLNQVTHDAGS